MILLRANFIAKCSHASLQVGRQLSAHTSSSGMLSVLCPNSIPLRRGHLRKRTQTARHVAVCVLPHLPSSHLCSTWLSARPPKGKPTSQSL